MPTKDKKQVLMRSEIDSNHRQGVIFVIMVR